MSARTLCLCRLKVTEEETMSAEICWQLRPDLHWPFRFRDDKIVEILKTFGTPALPNRSTVS